MAETDFYDVRSTRGGSRYPGFSSGGRNDATGNVNPAPRTSNPSSSLNASGASAVNAATPSEAPATSVSTTGSQKTSGGLSSLATQSVLPSVGKTAGQAVGSALGTGASVGDALGFGYNAVSDKIGNAIGNATSSISDLASQTVGKSAGASSVIKSPTASGGVGASIGAGLGTFAAGLLTGQGVAKSAISGVGSAAGTYLGTAIAGPIGGFIGGTLGSLVGGLFKGGKPTNAAAGGAFHLDNDTSDFWWQSNKGNSAQNLSGLQTIASNIRAYTQAYNAQNPSSPLVGTVNNIDFGVRDKVKAYVNGELVTASKGDFQGLQTAIINKLTEQAKNPSSNGTVTALLQQRAQANQNPLTSFS